MQESVNHICTGKSTLLAIPVMKKNKLNILLAFMVEVWWPDG